MRAKEVFNIIYELFASDKAQARFDANPSFKIKEWEILWLPDSFIIRPPALPKKNTKTKKRKDKEGNEVEEGGDDDEVGEKNIFSPLKHFIMSEQGGFSIIKQNIGMASV